MKIGDIEVQLSEGDGEPFDKATLSTSIDVTDWEWDFDHRPAVKIMGKNIAQLTVGRNDVPVIEFTHPSELTGLAAILSLAAKHMKEIEQ